MWWKDYGDRQVKDVCNNVLEKQAISCSLSQRSDMEKFGEIDYWCKLVRQTRLLYVINVGQDLYKIGTTWNIYNRLKEMRMANPFIKDSNQIVALFTKDGNKPPYILTTHNGRDGKYHHWASPRNYRSNPANDCFNLETCVHKWCHERGLNVDKAHKSELFKLNPSELQELFDYILGYPIQSVKDWKRELVESVEDQKGHKISFDLGNGEEWGPSGDGKVYMIPREAVRHMLNPSGRKPVLCSRRQRLMVPRHVLDISLTF